ncbi:LPS assembly lipoprotein LptE [Dyella nitratireducens]|uniref:LPS-assembly lipoprotein LptE n=1 Tax=Dyella nitratireducens TaxID=1849580 RepID=A0ABQ1G222_9GAMM|nr:LPS assembly lipoprotein LptE [Dyella nitratireducens]GGA35838.1 LPS-assembly lipoprotein LptE [Dyella nitratireducens]GLQ41051.1 LPS-assembly lipoprotein LptE [Dyella nitratireducens]
MNRMLKLIVLLLPVLALAGCGFHLRGSAALPQGMQRLHLTVGGGGDFQRKLARALLASNVTLEDKPGPGIAELHVPAQNFTVQSLTINGAAQVTEFAVRFHVVFTATDPNGKVIAPDQTIDLQREFSYDASQPVGTQSQMEQIQGSLTDDAIQAVLFRLQAIAKNGETAAAKAVGPLPANASTTQKPPEYMPTPIGD